jgi:hypothetical protein
MSYYYISLKWTRKNNSVFTFWCSNHSGYTQILEKAGIYEKKYENDSSKDVLSIEKEIVDKLVGKISGLGVLGDYSDFTVLPNIGDVRKELGITWLDFQIIDNSRDDFYRFVFKENCYENIVRKFVKEDESKECRYFISAKSKMVLEDHYYRETFVGKTRNNAIYNSFKEWKDSITDIKGNYIHDLSLIEFKKMINCRKEKELVFVNWKCVK